MILHRERMRAMLVSAADRMEQQSAELSDIDSRFGDGDHGVSIAKIARTMREEAVNWGEIGFHDFLERLGGRIMAVGAGSAGPLYGTMIGGLAGPLGHEETIDAGLLQRMLQESLVAMCDVTTARAGDKTMMDALIPAVSEGLAASGDVRDILCAAAKGAREGAESSRMFIAKFGRAKNYKEQTIGTPDAGALSTALLFEGLAEGCA